ncbi:probable cytochrome P450 9f2 [Culicoides brevitarsis]|uniref:probable cytochrome P450 9f2 n=1 Tax=Culicoides brevitarsis TaxID=469753 RepID=UPI00307B2C86
MGCLFWIFALSPILYLIWRYINKDLDYFAERNIPHEKPLPIFGNWFSTLFLGKPIPDMLLQLSNKFREHKLYGMFDMTVPMYVIKDPELIKQVMVKDFDHFVNHVPFLTSEGDALFGNSLFALLDEKWRNMRSTLSPAFTSSKMRMMYELVRNCADSFITYCNDNLNENGYYDINAKDIFSKATVDVISTCAFGLEVDSLKNPENEVYVNARKSFNFEDFMQQIKVLFIGMAPKLCKWLNINFIPKESSQFFKQIVADTIKHRRSTNTFRPDVIQLLIQAIDGKLKHESDNKDTETGFAVVNETTNSKQVTTKSNWSDSEVAAQCFLFFVAGFDTTSTTLTFALYELVVADDIQEKLFEEITETKNQLNGKPVTYEAIHKMEYLDAFVSEVLRHHPPGFLTDRVCNKNTNLKVDSGEEFFIPNKSKLWINVYGLHHDHQYFPNPMKFDPTRFLGENKKKIIPNTYMPFGLGPRACIGSRFALMEVKLMLYYLLSEFSVKACDKTSIPLHYSNSFALAPDVDLIVRLKKR